MKDLEEYSVQDPCKDRADCWRYTEEEEDFTTTLYYAFDSVVGSRCCAQVSREYLAKDGANLDKLEVEYLLS